MEASRGSSELSDCQRVICRRVDKGLGASDAKPARKSTGCGQSRTDRQCRKKTSGVPISRTWFVVEESPGFESGRDCPGARDTVTPCRNGSSSRDTLRRSFAPDT